LSKTPFIPKLPQESHRHLKDFHVSQILIYQAIFFCCAALGVACACLPVPSEQQMAPALCARSGKPWVTAAGPLTASNRAGQLSPTCKIKATAEVWGLV